jgi:hypothetical protein
MDRDGRPDLLDEWHHGSWAANAIEPDHVGSQVFDPFCRLAGLHAIAQLILLVQGEGDNGRKPGPLDHVKGDFRFAQL